MDKRRNDSYEETHRRLVEAMQEACIHDDFADYPEPDIDISFIYDDVEDDLEEIPAVEVPKKKRFGFTSRFNKVAAILVVLLFALLIVRGYWIAMHARDRFGCLIVSGLTTLLALQVFFNIGVVTNFLPSTGISLPFFSYGGTALVLQLVEMGIVLGVSRWNTQQLI